MQNRRAATRLEAAAPFCHPKAFPERATRIPATAALSRPAPSGQTFRAETGLRLRRYAPPRHLARKTLSCHPDQEDFQKYRMAHFQTNHYFIANFIRRIPENSLKRSESPEDYHRAIIPYRSILILRRLRAATPAKNKDAFRHPYRNDSLNRSERSVRRRHTCHIGFQPATNAVPRHSPNKLALHSAHNIFY